MVVMEKDEEIALFFEMRRRGAEDDDDLPALDEIDGSDPSFSPVSKRVQSLHVPLMDGDDFLNFESDAADYDWLLTPPDIPLFPLLDMESQKNICGQTETITGRPTSLKTKPANTEEDLNSGLEAPAPNLGPAKAGKKMCSVSRKTISVEGKFPSAKPSRSSAPDSHLSATSTSKPKKPYARSSTPSRPGSHLPTPTGKPLALAPISSKSAPRSSTPVRKESCSAVSSSVSAPPGHSSDAAKYAPALGPSVSAPPGHSSDVAKCASAKSKNAPIVRGKIPAAKTQEELVSSDKPLRSRKSLPERPASTSRGRPGASDLKRVSLGGFLNGKQRQKSCSPPKVRAPNISGFSGRNFISAWNRAHSKDSDNVNPVIIGSQMVERVVNMRKLVPPKPDGFCGQNKSAGKSSSSRDSSGFGLSLSKKSLDMAIRHMSIRGSPSSNLKPLNTKIAASSGRSTPTGSTKSSTTNLTDSPFATSSDTSSDPMVHFNSKSNNLCRNEGKCSGR